MRQIPDPKAYKVLREAIHRVAKPNKGTTCLQDMKALTAVLDKQFINLERTRGGDDLAGTIGLQTIVYEWPEMQVYRLYFNLKAKECQWFRDSKLLIGEKP
jgi:hypothetical protein